MDTYTHLSSSERNQIEVMLNQHHTLKQIAISLSRDLSGIRREILRNAEWSKIPNRGAYINDCTKTAQCRKRFLCSRCDFHRRPCRSCSKCNAVCPDFVKASCSRQSHAPYVCNGCSIRYSCKMTKRLYLAHKAQQLACQRLSVSRQGHGYTPEELARVEKLLLELIVDRSQSIHHIAHNNRDILPMSERHLYTLIDRRMFETRNIDLPAKVRYRPRKRSVEHAIDFRCRKHRTWLDFQQFIQEHPDCPVVEMDTVEGKKGQSVLLTLYFQAASLQLCFKREANTSASVIEIFDDLYQRLGHDDFTRLFPCILTDNGTEFSNPERLENACLFDNDGNIIQKILRTRLFYCDPQSPQQKALCERNHAFIRRFVPKGHSFDNYTQHQLATMMNHINNYQRDKIKMECPRSIFTFIYGSHVASTLGLSPIDPNLVCLNPLIFK